MGIKQIIMLGKNVLIIMGNLALSISPYYEKHIQEKTIMKSCYQSS